MYVIRYKQVFNVFIFLHLYYLSTLLIPVYLLISGGYSRELLVFGEYNLSLFFLIISILAFFSIATVISKVFIRNNFLVISSDSYVTFINYVLIFILILTTVYALPIIIYGSSYSLSLNRYEYADLEYSSNTSVIKHYIIAFSFMLGNALSSQVYKFRFRVIFLLIIILLVFILRGEKFSGLHGVLILFIAGYYTNRKFNYIRLAFYLSFFLMLIFGVYISSNIILNTELEFDKAYSILVSRLILQGQLLWISFQSNVNTLAGDLSFFSSQRIGMDMMMNEVLPWSELKNKQGGLTGGYPAILYFFIDSKLIAFFSSIFISIILTLSLYFSFLSIFYFKNAVVKLLFFIFFVQIFRIVRTIVGSGDLFLFTHPFVLLYFTILIIMLIFKNSRPSSSISDDKFYEIK